MLTDGFQRPQRRPSCAQLKDRATQATAQAGRAALSFVLIRDVTKALLTAAIGLYLFGAYLVLAKSMDPAAAAFTIGTVTFVGLAAAGWIGLRSLRRKFARFSD